MCVKNIQEKKSFTNVVASNVNRRCTTSVLKVVRTCFQIVAKKDKKYAKCVKNSLNQQN